MATLVARSVVVTAGPLGNFSTLYAPPVAKKRRSPLNPVATARSTVATASSRSPARFPAAVVDSVADGLPEASAAVGAPAVALVAAAVVVVTATEAAIVAAVVVASAISVVVSTAAEAAVAVVAVGTTAIASAVAAKAAAGSREPESVVSTGRTGCPACVVSADSRVWPPLRILGSCKRAYSSAVRAAGS